MRAAVVLIALALGAIHGTAAQAPGAGGAAAPRAETARETSLTPEQLKAAIDRLGTVDYAARMTAARALRRAPVAMVAPALIDAVSQHADGYVRFRALVLLSGMNDPRTRDVMVQALASPNRWPRSKVDHNLRTEDDPGAVAGPFDTASVMLYRFAPFFYKTSPSPCAPTDDGIELSDGDKRALQLLYPETAEEIAPVAASAQAALAELGAGDEEVIEAPGPSSPYHERAIALARSMAEAAG